MENRREAWLLWIEDASAEPQIFVGEGAEEAARAAYESARQHWTCRLFCESRKLDDLVNEKSQREIAEGAHAATFEVAKGRRKKLETVREICTAAIDEKHSTFSASFSAYQDGEKNLAWRILKLLEEQ